MSHVALEARPAPGTPICRLDELDPELGTWRLSWQEWDEPYRVFLVRKGETVYAYRNQCPHALAHLDHPPGDFFSRDRRHLQCSFHGAMFRIEDGFCISGPCRDRRLRPFPIRVADGVVYVGEPDQSARAGAPLHVRLARGNRG